MPKTIVNIVTEDNPVPAYLFIKEMYEPGDRLLFISAKDTEEDLDALAEQFDVPSNLIDEVVLKHDMDEITYEKICRTVRARLVPGVRYCVNLAGGTRYMALAVQQVFEKFHADYYYLDVEKNVIVKSVFDDSIYDDDDHFFPVKYRMSVAEYLRMHSVKHDIKNLKDFEPIRSREEAERLLNVFISGQLTSADYDVLETLRCHYRDKKRIHIQQVELAGEYGCPATPNLSAFLNYIYFLPKINGVLLKEELEYLTGGWFEEYVYYQVIENLKPNEALIGPHIGREGVSLNNELDVVCIKNNKLFVIECKSGVQGKRMFNEIVYKACALREMMLGISCYSYIFSLKKDHKEDLKRIAANMDIQFVDGEMINSKKVLVQVIHDMSKQAK
jgi:hypothetical protein